MIEIATAVIVAAGLVIAGAALAVWRERTRIEAEIEAVERRITFISRS